MSRSVTVYEFPQFLAELLTSKFSDKFESVALVSRDFGKIAVFPESVSSEYLDVAGGIILSVLKDTIAYTSLTNPSKVYLKLNDGKYLIVRSIGDFCLIVLTRPGERIGLIDMILEYHLRSNKQL